MDGNGRWAKQRGLPRAVGHQRGVEAVRRLVRSLEPTGLECLTLYAFSSENWKRSDYEVDDLMNLMRRFIKSDLPEFVANDVKLKIIGDWHSLAPDIVAMLEDALAQTANGKQTLAVALNYGAQHEIARAAVAEGATELHIVGGLHPSLPFSYYTGFLRELKALDPRLQLKCFTAIEILHLAWLAKKSVEQTLRELKEAGLESLTGGGAEIFRKEVRSAIAKGKESAEEYLDEGVG